MASRGRPPLPRGAYAFDDPHWACPAAVVLDTNVVAEALLASNTEHSECAAVLGSLSAEGAVVVFNELLEVELSQVLFVAALRERHPKKRIKDIAFDDRIRPRAARLLAQGQQAWADLLSTLQHSRVSLAEVASDVPTLMGSYGLESYDAVHAATVLATGITDFVSLDNGFAKLPPSQFVLHTTTARIRRTRERRRRAGF